MRHAVLRAADGALEQRLSTPLGITLGHLPQGLCARLANEVATREQHGRFRQELVEAHGAVLGIDGLDQR